MKALLPVALLTVSNIFMTFAWYGHLKNLNTKPLWIVILVSWGIAFAEYCFQVPGNRIGAQFFSLPQLKIIQEVITLVVFIGFAFFYMGVRPTMNFVWAGLCMVGALYFVFKDGVSS